MVAKSEPTHALPYTARFRIWGAMGPRRAAGQPPADAHTRRTRLAVACARRALPVWERRWPDRKTPQHALAAVEEALAFPARWERHVRIADACQAEIEGVLSDDFAAAYAGESAVDALRVAMYDEAGFDDDAREGDVQVAGPISDAAGNAANAVANGTTKNPQSDVGRRLEFWRWYLGEAVPAVYDAEPLHLAG